VEKVWGVFAWTCLLLVRKTSNLRTNGRLTAHVHCCTRHHRPSGSAAVNTAVDVYCGSGQVSRARPVLRPSITEPQQQIQTSMRARLTPPPRCPLSIFPTIFRNPQAKTFRKGLFYLDFWIGAKNTSPLDDRTNTFLLAQRCPNPTGLKGFRVGACSDGWVSDEREHTLSATP